MISPPTYKRENRAPDEKAGRNADPELTRAKRLAKPTDRDPKPDSQVPPDLRNLSPGSGTPSLLKRPLDPRWELFWLPPAYGISSNPLRDRAAGSWQPNTKHAFASSCGFLDLPLYPRTLCCPIPNEHHDDRCRSDVLVSYDAANVVRIGALDAVVEFVIIEIEVTQYVAEPEKPIYLVGIVMIEADENPPLGHWFLRQDTNKFNVAVQIGSEESSAGLVQFPRNDPGENVTARAGLRNIQHSDAVNAMFVRTPASAGRDIVV